MITYWAAKLNGTLLPWSCATDKKTCKCHVRDGVFDSELRYVKYIRVKITEIKKKKP